ncbi:hypothetical protein BDN70DRAFT_872097 [Pholiota conissans]|uniref:Integral membrane protein n=1 Tax=Pholiota conissans TaxID=109636 RepID=A0A9P5ZBW3_9AGAR|nr:hypothetical protein BDN70DRAFT_872097 [Pholiota conissans]
MLALPSPQRSSRSWLAEHEGHSDISRWHIPKGHEAPGAFIKRCARNALPDSVAHFFHPTRATLASKDDGHEMTQQWSSRKHRKQWYQYRSPTTGGSRHRDTMLGKLALMGKFEYWNISWWVAQAFTWGSVVWVINGFAVFLPFCNSHFDKAPNSSGWTAFLGATIFEFGSVFAIWEAWNADTQAFELYMGRAVARVKDDMESMKKVVEDAMNHNGRKHESPQVTMAEFADPAEKSPEQERPKWVWFSTETKYWHELGWYAAFFQVIAASIFWISGFTAIPTIQDAISTHTGLLAGVFWVPQVIGGTGFVISSTFIMLEAQHVWYLPELRSLGWHVGFWNFVGGVGFTLSGGFGFNKAHWSQYQSALSTFWGGWAFLIGSVIQWYESVNTV